MQQMEEVLEGGEEECLREARRSAGRLGQDGVHNVMSEVQQSREKSNQTASFNKLPEPRVAQSQELSSIPEESAELAHLQSSLSMPQPLIKSRSSEPNDREFSSKQSKAEQQSRGQPAAPVGPNITFYPQMAERLLYEDTALDQLKSQQANLRGELSGLSEMISDLIDKKNGLLSDYEQVIREKRAYKRLKKNLEQEYEAYLFMLDGDYCQRLDEESQRLRQVLVQLRHEVHALNTDLSRPLVRKADREGVRAEQLEKQFYEMQMGQEKLLSSNKRKQERLALLQQKINEKEVEIRQVGKQIDKCEYERELEEDEDPEEAKRNGEKYDELSKRLGKLRKIKEKNERVKEAEYHRKVKEGREKQAANALLDQQIHQANQRLYKVLIELDAIQQNPRASTVKEDSAAKQHPPAKRSTSAFKEAKHFLSEKNKLTLQAEAPTRPIEPSSKSLTRVQTEPVEGFDDRQELQMRRKKIYTELERNMYFKNIENREEEKLSRIHEFDSKNQIAISSYDRFARHQNPHPHPHSKEPLRLPEIEGRLATQGNDSIIYAYESVPHQRRLNKRSIEMHNRQIRQLRASKYHPNSSNYMQLCSLLNRDRLLIEEDCEYDMGQLIYNGRS